MDTLVFDEVDKELPQFTKRLAEGFALHQLTEQKLIAIHGKQRVATINEQYINELFDQAAKSFPPNLKYVGYSHVPADLEFNTITNKRRESKRYFDISRSDVYMVYYHFTLNGVPLDPVPLYLPFVSRGGICTIKGAKFIITPVIADVALSVGNDSLFLMGNRFKLTFERLQHVVFVDGIKEIEYAMWAQVYNLKDIRTTKTTLAHYLYCKFGVYQTFKMFSIDVAIEDVRTFKENEEKYPSEDWVKVTATGRKPSVRSRYQAASEIVLLIPRTQWGYEARSLCVAFFYVADIYPDKVTLDDVDNIVLWRRLLGKVLFGSNESEGKSINQINTHIASVDGYVDAMVSRWMETGGYPNINTIYELFKLVISIGPAKIATGGENIASLFNKRFVINRYINSDIVNGISNLLFSVQKHINGDKILKPEDMKTFFNIHLPYGLALRLNRDHPEVKSLSSASDCLIHKITSVTLLQTDASTTGGDATFGSDKVLDMSISEVAGHSNQPSRDPSGRSSINNCVLIDDDGTILQNPKYKERMDHYQSLIKRHQIKG